MVAGAQVAFERLLQSFSVPMTHSQWEEWLCDNLAVFRETMVSAPQLRQQGSYRVRARPHLPQAVGRLQPLAITDGLCHNDWARKLHNRTNWQGLKTRCHGVIVVFLIHLHMQTHYVQVRVTCKDPPQCMLETDFDIITSVAELGRLEAMLAAGDVLKLWEFSVNGTTALSRGVCITLGGKVPITDCATKPRTTAETGDGSDVDDDGEPVVLGSDVEEDECAVVDGDEESAGEFTVGSDTSSDANIYPNRRRRRLRSFCTSLPYRLSRETSSHRRSNNKP